MIDIEEIYKEYFKTVYKYLCCLTQNAEKAEEITQEDFEHYFAIIVIDKNNKEDISFNSIEKAENNTATIKVDRKENEEDYKYSGSLIIMPNSMDSIYMVGTNVDFVN